MHLPEVLLDSLSDAPGFDRDSFIRLHEASEPITSLRLNPLKPVTLPYKMRVVPWTKSGYYLDDRPSFTFDPFFHGGSYYVQEASSMLLEQAFLPFIKGKGAIRALDLCAAPGGKSTHLHSLLPERSMLVANEVIRSRALVLRDSVVRWGASNVMVTNNDPEHFTRLPDFFDWITVDAPCSGSGLFRKDHEAVDHWSLPAVEHCSQRQQRILAAAWKALRPGGRLFYSTCSYSTAENEHIAQWMQKTMGAVLVSISLDPAWGVTVTEAGYRCWPHHVEGEGFYFCCFEKPEGSVATRKGKAVRLSSLTQQELIAVHRYVTPDPESVFLKVDTAVYRWPEYCSDDWQQCMQQLQPVYSGVKTGQLVRDKLIPDHALAQHPLLHEQVPRSSLTKEQAIRYLQRKESSLLAAQPGWQVVEYEACPLGWINALPGRINNYYPKELRILKEQ